MFRGRAALCSGAFAALAVLVATGAFTRVDQWAIDHAMPGASFTLEEGGLLAGLVPFAHSDWSSAYSIAANIVTLPASFLVALAIVLLRSRILAAALVAAVAVEVVCKEVIERPALFHEALHIGSFDSSFPSGHALRTVLVAAVLARAFPRARYLALAWGVASIVLLELAGWHTPTDLAGGLLLALLALLGARAAGALGGSRLRGA